MSRRLIAAAALVGLLVASAPSPAGQAGADSFGDLAARASAARDANRLDEAIGLYHRALELRPEWDEGLWYLSTLYYESDRYAEGRDSFAKLLGLKPELGPAWVLRGLCDFQVGDFASSLDHITRGIALGGSGTEILRVARYHEALLLVRAGQFELAVRPLTMLARAEPESLGLTEPIGLMLLRMPIFPKDVPDAERELVRKTGHAGYLHLARRGEEAAMAYAELVAENPEHPWLRYAHGVFLLSSRPEEGLAELRRAAELAPGEFYPYLEIAFELLRQADPEGALEAASKAVALAPGLFAAQNAYGRALVELGRYDEGVAALEKAVELAPESPEMQFSLARGYQQAGRTEDAARARGRFTELDKQRREGRQRAGDPEESQ